MAADLIFPSEFLWGSATSSYQIEGAHNEDGKGPSIWDTFSHTPGKIAGNDTGDIACDHYHRYESDIQLMKDLELRAYRFSIAWPRIFPNGIGSPNEAGLDFYKRLVDGLRDAGIEPMVTLYHWDLPQALQDQGGWANHDTASRFGEFAHTIVRALGGSVDKWITHNEPWVVAFLGNLMGIHAPGIQNLRTALLVSHNLLVSHAEAYDALKAEFRDGQEVGITLNLAAVEPADDTEEDVSAATRADGFMNRWFLDPLFKGRYPEDMLEYFGDDAPDATPDDLRRISRPLDFLGVNYYTRSLVRSAPEGMGFAEAKPGGAEYTEMGWEVYPEGLYNLLTRLHNDYAPPKLYITENGAAYLDTVVDGVVEDTKRRDYIHKHLVQCYRAIQDGVPLSGYFVWSLMDNFEWAEGYSKRFGVVYVDFESQQRIVKASGRWYSEVVAENGVAS